MFLLNSISMFTSPKRRKKKTEIGTTFQTIIDPNQVVHLIKSYTIHSLYYRFLYYSSNLSNYQPLLFKT
jgi:hypothetical protein